MNIDDIGIYIKIDSLEKLLFIQKHLSKICSSCNEEFSIEDRIYIEERVCEECRKKDVIIDNL